MKTLALVVLLALTGCVSVPKTVLSCDESCAMQNMVCSGMSFGESSGSSTRAWRPGDTLADSINPQQTNHSVSHQSFQCVRDESKATRIKTFREYAATRTEYNELRCGTFIETLANKQESELPKKCDGVRARIELLQQALASN